MPIRKTNFSQFALTMSSGISALIFASRQAARNFLEVSFCESSRGPN